MKKLLGVTIALLLLLVPVVASAYLIQTDQELDSIQLELSYTPGVSSGTGYATDYQGIVNGSYPPVELFCVESEAMIASPLDYTRYTLDTTDLRTMQVSWIAENYVGDGDQEKGLAQVAIWAILETVRVSLFGESLNIYNAATALSLGDFDTSGWLLASREGAQDYLMRAAPVPEPATMLLLGTGLVGLAGVSRKKFKK